MKKNLREAIETLESLDLEFFVKKPSRGRPKGGTTRTTTVTSPGTKYRASVAAGDHTSTPPAYVRHQFAAALRTTASSTVSSLTSRSSTTISSRRATRNNPRTSVESDTDDGSDVDEERPGWRVNHDDDEEELNPQNFYQSETEDETPDDDDPSQPLPTQSCMAAHVKKLKWKFEQITNNTTVKDTYYEYEGPTGLKEGVAESFQTPFECVAACGGLNYDLVSRLAIKSNNYFKDHIKPTLGKNNVFHKMPWRNIDVTEMYRFLGILLKISLAAVDGGGYEAYFRREDLIVYTGTGHRAKKRRIANTKGFAVDYMSLNRFKQIRSAFHPEDKEQSLGGDKCYQLRHALNQLNQCSLRTFYAGKRLAFDEGGISCRSRMCPVRQYNKDKPDKYRVDFFVLADSEHYNILHMDVYQLEVQA